jgi:sarcosine oxidase subunit gamma
MADPSLRQSPLAALHLDGRAGEASEAAGVRLGERRFIGKLDLRAAATDSVLMAALGAALGFALPLEPNRASGAGEICALWLGPDEWLITTPPGGEADMMARLTEAVRGRHGAVTEVSDGRTVICLSGARAREVLAKGCGLDLHPRLFGPGRCAQSALARAAVIVHQIDERPSYELYVDASFAAYLWAWLEDAAGEYGLAIVPS